MNAPRVWKVVPALLACCVIGLAYGKLPAPAPSEEQKAKAAEAKTKADDAAKKEGELLGKSQDRVADYYQRTKGAVVKTSAAVAPKE